MSASWCYVHESPELTQDEDALVNSEDGELDAICIPVLRLDDLVGEVGALRDANRTRDWDYHAALDDVLALLGKGAA